MQLSLTKNLRVRYYLPISISCFRLKHRGSGNKDSCWSYQKNICDLFMENLRIRCWLWVLFLCLNYCVFIKDNRFIQPPSLIKTASADQRERHIYRVCRESGYLRNYGGGGPVQRLIAFSRKRSPRKGEIRTWLVTWFKMKSEMKKWVESKLIV